MSEIVNATIACLITTITLYIAGIIVFNNNKRNSLLKDLVSIVLCTLLITIIFINFDGMVKTILMCITFTFVLKNICNTSTSKALLMSIAYIIILILADFITLILALTILNIPKEEIYSNFAGSILGNVCTNLVMILIIFLLRKPIRKALSYNFSTNKKIIAVSIITIIITVYFFFKVIIGYKMNDSIIPYLISMIAFIAILLTLYKEKIENESIIKKYDELLDVMKTYEKDIEHQKIVMHESKNELMTIRSKAIDSKASKEFISYIDSIIGDKVSSNTSNYSKFANLPSNGLKGFFYYKCTEAEKRGISVAVNVSKTIENSFLKDLDTKTYKDLARIIGVYLDNAIEASEKSDKKQLGIEVYLINKNVKIIISNTFMGEINVDKIGKEKYTTKGKNHGHGLLLVNNILHNNNRFDSKNSIEGNIYIQELIVKSTESWKNK